MGMYRFKKLKDSMIAGKHDAKTVVAQKPNGDLYEKQFFANNKDLIRKFAGFGDGDWIELIFDETRFKNLQDVKEGKKPEDGESWTPNSNRPKTSSKPENYVRRADGTTRGDDTNRSAAIYFVKDIVRTWYEGQTAAKKKDISVEDLISFAICEAQPVFDYIANGKVTFPVATGEPESDPLDPEYED